MAAVTFSGRTPGLSLTIASSTLFLLGMLGSARAQGIDPSVEHIIVCPAALEAPFIDLAAHRTSAGITSQVITLEEVLDNTPSGRDDAETLRDFLVQLRNTTSLRFVLLGGDTDVLPHRLVRSRFYPSGGFTDLSTDLYFGGLDGDWDSDGDGIFGEAYTSVEDPGDDADLDADVAVGRAPVSTPAEARRFVDGVVAYDGSATAPHHGSALLGAEVLFPADWTGGTVQLDGAVYAEEVRDRLSSHPATPTSTRMYERSDAFPGSLPLTATDFLNALDGGGYGTVLLVGHGSSQEVSCGTGTIGIVEIDALTNAPRYGLAVGLWSEGARIEEESFLEHLLTAPDGGSAASFGFTTVSFPVTAGEFTARLFEELSAASGVLVGEAMDRVRATYVSQSFFETSARWTLLSFCLLGDPAMPYRAEESPVSTEQSTLGGLKARFRR